MSSPADALIDALRSGHDELVVLVADLSPAELAGPSACHDWDLSQVLSHLGSGAEIQLGALARAVDPSTPVVANTEIWDRWNAMSPHERLAGFLITDEKLVEAYEAFDERTRRELRIDLGFLPEPVDVATAARFRLNELALHSWDVRVIFDPAAGVAEEATPLLLEHVETTLGWIGKAERLAGEHVVAVETTDPDRRFGLSITDTVGLTEPPAGTGTTVRLPAEAWLRLATGRLDADHTPPTHLEGELSLDDLRAVFPGF